MIAAPPRVRSRDAAGRLADALVAHAAAAGVALTVRAWRSHPWSSATFTGERHVAQVDATGPALAAWIAALPDADLPLGRHLVADLAIAAAPDGGHAITALTIAAA